MYYVYIDKIKVGAMWLMTPVLGRYIQEDGDITLP